MASGSFTVGATTYDFEVNSDEVGEEVTAEVNEELMLGGTVTYVTLGGTNQPHKTLSLFFKLAADYAAFKAALCKSGTLVTTRDGTENAVLLSLRRTRRNWNGETDASSTWLILP